MSGRDWAYGRALFFFGIAGILGALILFVRGPQDLPYMGAQGKFALTLALASLVICALLLVLNSNPWFRVAGAVVLLVLASVLAGVAVDGAMRVVGPSENPSTPLLITAALVGSNPASLNPDGMTFRLLMLGLGIVTYVAAARYNWLGLDGGSRSSDSGHGVKRAS